MLGIPGHPRLRRLLKHTAATFCVAMASAGVANADIGLSSGSDSPLAPLSATVAQASSTATGVLDTTISTTDGTLATAASTVGAAQDSLTETVDETLSATGETVAEVAPPTIVDQTVERVTSTGTSPVPPTPPLPATPEDTALSGALHESPQPRAREPAASAVQPRPSVYVRTPGGSAPARVRPKTKTQLAPGARIATVLSPHESRSAWVKHIAPSASRPSIPGRDRSEDRTSIISMLVSGTNGGAQPVAGALLGLLGFVLFGGLGPRLRPRPTMARSPDLLFRLERPG